MTNEIETGDNVRIKDFEVQSQLYPHIRGNSYLSGLEGQVVCLHKAYDWMSTPDEAKVRVYIHDKGIRPTAWEVCVNLCHIEITSKGNGTFKVGETCPYSEQELFDQRLAAFDLKVLKAKASVDANGFCNMATHLAQLYIVNDQAALREARSQRRKDGTINPDKVKKIFYRHRLQVDDWAFEPPIEIPHEFKPFVLRQGWGFDIDWKEVADNIPQEGQ
jgi:hypothetical protein